jgi:hypothetical protein
MAKLLALQKTIAAGINEDKQFGLFFQYSFTILNITMFLKKRAGFELIHRFD